MAQRPHHIFEYGFVPAGSRPGRDLYLANVECVLYLDGTTRADAPQRLRTAFEELARLSY